MPPRRYPWCEQKQKLLVNVLYRPDIMIFVFQNIRSLPRLLQPVRLPRRTITVRSEITLVNKILAHERFIVFLT